MTRVGLKAGRLQGWLLQAWHQPCKLHFQVLDFGLRREGIAATMRDFFFEDSLKDDNDWMEGVIRRSEMCPESASELLLLSKNYFINKKYFAHADLYGRAPDRALAVL
jgi:hypothetical protein